MGLGMVQKQLQDFLKDSGVEPVEAVGAEFDPNLHEAIGQNRAPRSPKTSSCASSAAATSSATACCAPPP